MSIDESLIQEIVQRICNKHGNVIYRVLYKVGENSDERRR